MGPVTCGVLEARAGSHIVLSNLGVLWVVRLWAAEERLEGYKGRFEREHGGPGVLEDVEAYRA